MKPFLSVSVRASLHFQDISSWWIFTKSGTEIANPKSENEFVAAHWTPIMTTTAQTGDGRFPDKSRKSYRNISVTSDQIISLEVLLFVERGNISNVLTLRMSANR